MYQKPELVFGDTTVSPCWLQREPLKQGVKVLQTSHAQSKSCVIFTDQDTKSVPSSPCSSLLFNSLFLALCCPIWKQFLPVNSTNLYRGALPTSHLQDLSVYLTAPQPFSLPFKKAKAWAAYGTFLLRYLFFWFSMQRFTWLFSRCRPAKEARVFALWCKPLKKENLVEGNRTTSN